MNTSYRAKRANATADIEMELREVARQLTEISERVAQLRNAASPRMSRDIVALYRRPDPPAGAARVRHCAKVPSGRWAELTALIPDTRRFGKRLRELRQSQGLTVEALGELVAATTTSVYRWEAGAGRPSVASLVELADLYGISLDALVEKTYETSASAETHEPLDAPTGVLKTA